MFIIDGVYRNVDISGLSAPIIEGTVLTETGAIASADGSDAFGIVPQNIYEIPPTKLASVVVGGTIDLLSPANANVEFSEAVMKALGTDINFVQNSEAANEVPKPTAADAGKVVTVNQDGDGYVLGEGGGGQDGLFHVVAVYDGETDSWSINKTATEINSAFNSGLLPYLSLVDNRGITVYQCLFIGNTPAVATFGTMNAVINYEGSIESISAETMAIDSDGHIVVNSGYKSF